MKVHPDGRALPETGSAGAGRQASRAAIPFAWYAAWWALAASSVGSSFPNSVSRGHAALLFGMGLVCAAAFQVPRAGRFVSRKDVAFAFVVLLSFVGAQTVYREWANGPAASNFGFDFSAYYLAAKAVPAGVAGGLYQLPLYPDGRLNLNVEAPADSGWHKAAQGWGVPFSAPFIYPPFFAIPLRPLGWLPFADAFLAWRVCMACCYLGGAVIALRSAGARARGHMVPVWCVALFSYYPFLEGLALGQANSLVFLLLSASIWLFAREHTGRSALCFAAAAWIKLTPLLLLPVFIIHRRWKWLSASLAWTGVLLGFSIHGAGWAAHRQFFHDVLPRLSCGAPIVSNASLIAYVQELCLGQVSLWQHAPAKLPAHICTLSRCVGLAVYAMGMLMIHFKRKQRAYLRDFSAMVLLTLLVSPISWWHHYTIAVLPILYLWTAYPERSHRLLLALWAVVGTNAAGFALLLATSPTAQLTLAAVVPALVLGVFVVTVLGPEPGGLSACVPAAAQ